MCIITRGLGAGSYPQAPDLKEPQVPCCAGCGSQEGDLAGTELCPGCRWQKLLWPNRHYAQQYIEGHTQRRADFYLSFLWGSLSQEAQIALLRDYFIGQEGLPYHEYLCETQEEFLAYLACHK